MRRATYLLALLLTACGGPGAITETGNPEMQMRYEARTADPDRVSIDGGAATAIALDEVTISVGDVRFVEGDACDTSAEIEHDAPGLTADLLLDPEPVVFTLPATAYCRVRVRLDRADALDDAAIRVHGTRADGTPVTLVSRATPEVDVRSRGTPFALSEARDRLALAFGVDAWFAGLDLDGADPTGGEVVIDEDHNEDLLDAFDDGVEAALALYDEVDGGELADSE
jgi:hypothetical protein